jgi:heme-degrading monooxygenase HmoA
MYPIGLLQTPSKPLFPFEVILDCCLARAEDGTTMFVILWEFEVKPGCQERFERVYGPLGAWVQLFLRDPRFRGSQLLRDPSRTLFYFTLDFWDSETAYQDFQNAHRPSYEQLDGATETLTLKEHRIGSFTMSQ